MPSIIGHYRVTVAQLAAGSFGSVSLAEDMESGSLVAIKTVPDAEWDACEHACLAALSHPNVLRLRDYYRGNGNHYLVTDYAAGGDLFDFLDGKPYLDESVARQFFAQLVACIEHVHRAGFAHRDLKLENVFLDASKRNVIVGDWGFATPWAPGVLLTERCGTLFYLPPEMISGAGYVGPEVDMWSLGVLLYYLLVGSLPFDAGSNEETEQRILHCQPAFPAFLSPDARHLLQSLLCRAPLRLTAAQAMQHPWVRNEAAAFQLPCGLLSSTTKRDARAIQPSIQLDAKHPRLMSTAISFFEPPFDYLPQSDIFFDDITPMSLVCGQ